MTKIAYYLILKPLSKLPLNILYVFSNFIYFFSYKVVKYRRSVVWENIRNSFPTKSEKEIKTIVEKFYRHFSDLVIESIKMFSMSKQQAIKRCKVQNPEVLNKLYKEGKSAILVGGHYNNWEIAALILNIQIKHLAVGIYTPLSNSFLEKKFRETRSKYGTLLVPKKKINTYFETSKQNLNLTMFIADQSPFSINNNTYWTTFLNQKTAVMLGTEKYAIKNNYPVVFSNIIKVKRGYYQIVFELLEENPTTSAHYSITEKHTRLLEKQIIKEPACYLWTHKRWKHKKPANLD